jgi:hypothetical protein
VRQCAATSQPSRAQRRRRAALRCPPAATAVLGRRAGGRVGARPRSGRRGRPGRRSGRPPGRVSAAGTPRSASRDRR